MKHKKRTGEMPVPGVRAVQALLEHAPQRIRQVMYAGELSGARGAVVEQARLMGVKLNAVQAKVLDERFEGVRHQGVMALVAPAEYVDWPALIAEPDALVVAVDQVTDPRNLGAMLRSAEAMGATGALLTSNRCARLGPTVAKTSAGASELLPVAMETNLVRSLKAAQKAGAQVVGADLDGVPPEKIDFRHPTIVVVGAEGRGLRRLTRESCDFIVTIPLQGFTESLNAASAGSILVYEAAQQRRMASEKMNSGED